MIYPLGGLVIGALLGAVMAKRKGGKALDLLQWAAVTALMLGMVGLFIAIFLSRAAT